jgi:hypothetical protein
MIINQQRYHQKPTIWIVSEYDMSGFRFRLNMKHGWFSVPRFPRSKCKSFLTRCASDPGGGRSRRGLSQPPRFIYRLVAHVLGRENLPHKLVQIPNSHLLLHNKELLNWFFCTFYRLIGYYSKPEV